MLGTGIAILWINLERESYIGLAHRLHFLVNDIGMAFFFALMSQEATEAVMPGGALHTWRRWALPIVAAIGVMAGAVAVYGERDLVIARRGGGLARRLGHRGSR